MVRRLVGKDEWLLEWIYDRESRQGEYEDLLYISLDHTVESVYDMVDAKRRRRLTAVLRGSLFPRVTAPSAPRG